jgi:hypothetical protein
VEVHDAALEPAFVEQLQPCADALGQGALAPSHHDREQEQVALVDQPRGDRLAG